MIEISKINIGDKVHYQPEHYGKNKWENGIVKEIRDTQKNKAVWVVYNCENNWPNYKNYTSARTNLTDLKYGWR